MKVYSDLSKVLKTGKKLLSNNPPTSCTCSNCEQYTARQESDWEFACQIAKWILIIGLLFLAVFLMTGKAHAYSEDKIVTAIGHAENSKSHPYGIIPKYKHTSPRQACLNTVKRHYRLWVKAGRHGDFIAYLGSKYAPIGVLNDPKDLNRNWVKNVHYFLSKEA